MDDLSSLVMLGKSRPNITGAYLVKIKDSIFESLNHA